MPSCINKSVSRPSPFIIKTLLGTTSAILVPWKSEVQVFENILKGKVDDFSLY
jgi:hypothetical protein